MSYPTVAAEQETEPASEGHGKLMASWQCMTDKMVVETTLEIL